MIDFIPICWGEKHECSETRRNKWYYCMRMKRSKKVWAVSVKRVGVVGFGNIFFSSQISWLFLSIMSKQKKFSLWRSLFLDRKCMVFGIVAGPTVILSCSWSVNSYIVVSRPSVPSTRCSASARGTGAWPASAAHQSVLRGGPGAPDGTWNPTNRK